MNATQKMVSYFIMINIVNFIVGAVPVIVVLTKADALKLPAVCQLMSEEGLTMREVMPRVEDYAASLLGILRGRIKIQLSGCKYPPKGYISVAGKYSNF